MTFFFHQLKNFIQNDPLSDWLTHVHRLFNCFEPDQKTTFQEEIDEKKSSYKIDFFGFLKKYKEHVFYKDLTSEQTKELIDAKEGQIVLIPQKAKHSLKNPNKKDAKIAIIFATNDPFSKTKYLK